MKKSGENLKTNNKNKVEISILIYTKDKEKLWELRNFFYDIQEKLQCKLNLSLTCNLQTAFNMFVYVVGGADVFISDEIIPKECEETLQRQIKSYSPMCRSITKKIDGYSYVFNFVDGLKIIEHWKNEDISFENRLYDLINRLINKEISNNKSESVSKIHKI